MVTKIEAGYSVPAYPVDVKFLEKKAGALSDNDFYIRERDVEVLIVNNGEVTVEADNQVMSAVAGQLIMIDCGLARRVTTSKTENTAYYRLVFSPAFVLDLTVQNELTAKYINILVASKMSHLFVLDETNMVDETIINIINEIVVANMVRKTGYEILTRGYLCSLFVEIVIKFGDHPVRYNGRNAPSRDEIRVKAAVEYLRANYSDYIKLDDIANKIHISRNECCRCFKRVLGMSPVDYLIKLRIYEAARIIYKDPLSVGSIQEIALNIGFNNISYFNRVFRKNFECTPSQFVSMIKDNPAKAGKLYEEIEESVLGRV